MLTLKQQKRITLIFKAGKVYKGKFLKIYYNYNNLEEPGIVISVPRKIGKAVKRNYIKRVIKNLFRHVEIPYDLLIRVNFLNVNYQLLKNEIEVFLESLKYEKNDNISH